MVMDALSQQPRLADGVKVCKRHLRYAGWLQGRDVEAMRIDCRRCYRRVFGHAPPEDCVDEWLGLYQLICVQKTIGGDCEVCSRQSAVIAARSRLMECMIYSAK